MRAALIVALSLVLFGCGEYEQPALPSGDGWAKVGQSGMMHLVAVEKNREGDRGTYRAAAAALCPDRRERCYILFWSDRLKVPHKLPMHDVHAEAQTGAYTRNPPRRFEELLLLCKYGGPKSECFEP